jgi:hypothetical protein
VEKGPESCLYRQTKGQWHVPCNKIRALEYYYLGIIQGIKDKVIEVSGYMTAFGDSLTSISYWGDVNLLTLNASLIGSQTMEKVF